jgi:hypothetical protein
MLRYSDHADVMTSGMTANTRRTVSVLFVGNSFTATNDLPVMLVNIAAADPGNTVQLAVKAVTYPGADLNHMLTRTDALAWAQKHSFDYVVLQERSAWYAHPQWIESARANAAAWRDALRPLKVKPILFESWADRDGSVAYTDPTYYAYGKTFKEITRVAQRETDALAQNLGMSVVRVGRAFYFAVQSRGPDLFQADGHHASRAGAYLGALAFYRYFTKRSGAESIYRPWGVSAADAAALVQASGR